MAKGEYIKQYNWKRFWYPLGSENKLTDFGFLSDPESNWGMITNKEAVSLASLSDIHCLILLGEPGIGKSYALEEEYKNCKSQTEISNNYVDWIDLVKHSNEERLIRELSKNLKKNNKTFIFLDSLDECGIPLKSISSVLIEGLKEYPPDCLYLRIACRFSEWKYFDERDLKKIWKNKSIQKYELAPLRRKDVITAAEDNGLNSEKFLREIVDKEIIPLAIKPITLKFLIDNYLNDNNFPKSQIELYHNGCLSLCTEIDSERSNSGQSSSPEQRLRTAARIATIMKLTNRSIIDKDINWGKKSRDEITINELSGGTQIINGKDFSVDEYTIKEALSTALFTGYDRQKVKWSHQTYLEFLAAWYLRESRVSLRQIQSLIMHEDGKLIPQFHEIAAWLAGMKKEVFSIILESDPEILLRGDTQALDDKNRRTLVGKLLEIIKAKKLPESIDLSIRYHKFNHSSLVNQLYPILTDKSQELVLRRMAINIARDCELQQLQEELCTIALDKNEALEIRTPAAYATCCIGEPKIKKKLLPLALGKADDDPDDELKGCGLKAVWPDHLNAEDLFKVLTTPKKNNFYGVYKTFISHELLEYLSAKHLPIALKWVAKIRAGKNHSGTFDKATDSIMIKAWDHYENLDILKAFARAAYISLKWSKPIINDNRKYSFTEAIKNDDIKRRKLIEMIIPLVEDPEEDSSRIVFSNTRIFFSKDVLWMIENLNSTKSRRQQQIWAYLINNVFELNNPQHVDALITAVQHNKILKDVLGWLLKTVDLDSPEAEKMRKKHYKRLKENKNRPLSPLPLNEPIENLLKKCEAGMYHVWWDLLKEISSESDRNYPEIVCESDILSLPAWKSINSNTQNRIIQAGKALLLYGDPHTQEFLEKKLLSSSLAGFKALELLLKQDPDFITGLQPEIWKKWAPIVLAWHSSSSYKDEEELYYSLLNLAYQNAPDEILETLLFLIDKQNKENGYIDVHYKMESFCDNQIVDVLIKKIQDPHLTPKSTQQILDILLANNINKAKKIAKSLLQLPLPKDKNEFEKSIVAGISLVKNTDDASWDFIWPIIMKNTEFGKQIISDIAYRDSRKLNVMKKLSEIQLTELYVWLLKQYPPSEDLKNKYNHTVTPRESVGKWRDSILHHLKERGTKKAVQAIKNMLEKFPDNENLNWIYRDAQSIYREKSWQPLKIGEIKEILSNSQKRLIQNEQQLFEVVIEALYRYQEKILGRFSPVEDLWNIDKKNKEDKKNEKNEKNEKNKWYWPKDENALSRHIARHLEEDLSKNCILINREVETRKGQLTDIHVDLIAKERESQDCTPKRLSIIIEVKKCSHSELWKAMKDQLMNKYLKDNQCQHGIYLVGWFVCENWNKNKKKFNSSIQEVRTKLEEQARDLSNTNFKIKAFVLDARIS